MSSAAALSSPSASRNPLEAIRSHLIRRLCELPMPAAHAIGEVPELLRDAANIFDEFLFAIGQHVGERVNVDMDIRPFQGAFLGAVEGNADYEIECVIERSSQYRTLRRAG